MLEETQEQVERREELDAQLASYVRAAPGASDRSDRDTRAATWGRTAAHQRAMRRAITAGGGEAKVGR